MSSPGERHATHFTYSGGFNHIFSYDDMHITGMNVREGPTYGYNKVEITGTHIGRVDAPAQPHVYIGGKPCMDTTVLSTDVLECTVPSGVGVNVSVHIQYFNVTSIEAPGITYTYNPPKIFQVEGEKEGGVYGGNRLSITGENLGIKDTVEPVIKVGPYPCVNVTVNSNDNVECTTSPGTSSSNKVTMTILGVPNSDEDKLFKFDYQVPEITDTVGETPWYGNTTLLIFGKYLGTDNVEDLDVKIGGVACLELEVENEGELKCVIPPGRGNQEIEVIVETSAQD